MRGSLCAARRARAARASSGRRVRPALPPATHSLWPQSRWRRHSLDRLRRRRGCSALGWGASAQAEALFGLVHRSPLFLHRAKVRFFCCNVQQHSDKHIVFIIHNTQVCSLHMTCRTKVMREILNKRHTLQPATARILPDRPSRPASLRDQLLHDIRTVKPRTQLKHVPQHERGSPRRTRAYFIVLSVPFLFKVALIWSRAAFHSPYAPALCFIYCIVHISILPIRSTAQTRMSVMYCILYLLYYLFCSH